GGIKVLPGGRLKANAHHRLGAQRADRGNQQIPADAAKEGGVANREVRLILHSPPPALAADQLQAATKLQQLLAVDKAGGVRADQKALQADALVAPREVATGGRLPLEQHLLPARLRWEGLRQGVGVVELNVVRRRQRRV